MGTLLAIRGPCQAFSHCQDASNAAHPLTPACGAGREGAGSVVALAAGLDQAALERLHAVRRNAAADDDHAAAILADGLPARLKTATPGRRR